MRRISLEISGRIDEVPETIGGWTHKPGEWRHWSGERLASDDLLDAIRSWADRHGALATVMVRLDDDATGGDDDETGDFWREQAEMLASRITEAVLAIEKSSMRHHLDFMRAHGILRGVEDNDDET